MLRIDLKIFKKVLLANDLNISICCNLVLWALNFILDELVAHWYNLSRPRKLECFQSRWVLILVHIPDSIQQILLTIWLLAILIATFFGKWKRNVTKQLTLLCRLLWESYKFFSFLFSSIKKNNTPGIALNLGFDLVTNVENHFKLDDY